MQQAIAAIVVFKIEKNMRNTNLTLVSSWSDKLP